MEMIVKPQVERKNVLSPMACIGLTVSCGQIDCKVTVS